MKKFKLCNLHVKLGNNKQSNEQSEMNSMIEFIIKNTFSYIVIVLLSFVFVRSFFKTVTLATHHSLLALWGYC
jgi:hypothetical protein